MANKKVTMIQLRAIIKEFAKGTPMREIERKLSISRTSLRPYKERAEASGKTMYELLRLEDADLNSILSKDNVHRNRDADRYAFLQGNFEQYTKKLAQRYMTYEVLYTDTYCHDTDNPYGYTQFKAILKKYIKDNDLKLHNVYIPAHEMQFDFAGDNLWIKNPKTGEASKVVVLVCILPYSGMSFVTAMPRATMEYTFSALSKAIVYFGGVAEVTKTDNMVQWVKKYNRYEPQLNEAAMQWAMYHGTDMDFCRIGRPRDKGPAEGLAGKIYKVYYSRVYNEEWHSVEQLNLRFDELNDFFNDIVPNGHNESRRSKFEAEEKPLLLPPPAIAYSFKYEKVVNINSTYHFQLERARFYSVPYQYVGKKAKVVYDAETVEVWCEMKRIAVHKRMYYDGYSTIPEHMPERHRAYVASKEFNAAYFQKRASQVGPETRAVIDAVLARPYFIQQAYRGCQGILRLGVRYTEKRLEAACGRIEPKSAAKYSMVESILSKGLDLDNGDGKIESDESYMPSNENVRGPEEYK